MPSGLYDVTHGSRSKISYGCELIVFLSFSCPSSSCRPSFHRHFGRVFLGVLTFSFSMKLIWQVLLLSYEWLFSWFFSGYQLES